MALQPPDPPREDRNLADRLRAAANERSRSPHGLSNTSLFRMAVPSDTGPRRFAVKLSSPGGDWVRRGTQDDGAREVALFLAGLHDSLPPEIEWPALAARRDGKDAWHLVMADLESDESARFVSADEDLLSEERWTQQLVHLATLHRTFLDRRGTFSQIGFCAVESWLTLFGPATLERERTGDDQFFSRVALGWDAFHRLAPATVSGAVSSLLRDPSPMVETLSSGPLTLLHGDYTSENIGWRDDTASTTIALNWSQAMWGPPVFDLCWYLAVASPRLPVNKVRAIEVYHGQMHDLYGDDWQRSLDLGLLGAVLRFGWALVDEEVGADQADFDWWLKAAERALAHVSRERS